MESHRSTIVHQLACWGRGCREVGWGAPEAHARMHASTAPEAMLRAQLYVHLLLLSVKVRHLELHPTQPWLATASKSDVVTIWDWSSRQ
eukprot:scaffold238656_cov21-Tisochrysis_lutea.AAC.1